MKSDPWRFHDGIWGPLTVVVMPRTIDKRLVVDSNTGIVTKAPNHLTLLGSVVVNDGRRPNADERAINRIVMGDENICWHGKTSLYTIPTRVPTDDERSHGVYQEAVSFLMKSRGLTRERAIGECDAVLIWCPDSFSCGVCSLTIPGLGAVELIRLAREYGWKMGPDKQSGRCATCASSKSLPLPTEEEALAMQEMQG